MDENALGLIPIPLNDFDYASIQTTPQLPFVGQVSIIKYLPKFLGNTWNHMILSYTNSKRNGKHFINSQCVH
jgi:hypothetical protein